MQEEEAHQNAAIVTSNEESVSNTNNVVSTEIAKQDAIAKLKASINEDTQDLLIALGIE